MVSVLIISDTHYLKKKGHFVITFGVKRASRTVHTARNDPCPIATRSGQTAVCMPGVLNGWFSIDWKICPGIAAILNCRAFWKNIFVCHTLGVAVQDSFPH
jgi:hypothetical protein